MNTFKTTLGGALAIGLCAGAMASDFNVEVGGQYIDFDASSAYGADISVFFQPVSIEQGPFAEAGFLNRASNISAAYLREKDGDFNVYGIGGEFYFDDFYLAISYGRITNGSSLNNYGVRVGYMLAENTRAHIGFERTDLGFFGDLDTYSIGVKHVVSLSADTAVNLEGAIGIADNGSNDFFYDFRADYYLSRSFGLGARFSGVESDNEWGLGARYFFTPRFSAGAEYSRASGDDTIALRLAARF